MEVQGVCWSEMYWDAGEKSLVDGLRQGMGSAIPDGGLSACAPGKKV